MRILCLDVGSKTIGVALSDALGWTAQGIETIYYENGEYTDTFNRINELVKSNEVNEVVVGLPKNMNGSIGERGEFCQQFAANLADTINIKVILWDERLSTVAAEKALIEADLSRKKRKKVIDKMAAVYILQGYLNSKT
ncbi:MAG: Holliday junction resolvase [Bacillales bacterium]|jgi:putative Holliday junction resolvase|nr:Holliday junction resolvase [Bacillales bacterium]